MAAIETVSKRPHLYDACECGQDKNKKAARCLDCHRKRLRAIAKEPAQVRDRSSEYNECPTCGKPKKSDRTQCRTCSWERPLNACPEPGCKGRMHRTPVPEWLPEAAKMARDGVPALQIAKRFGVDHKAVRDWLPHAGVLGGRCHEDGCETEVGPGSPYCVRHVAKHKPPPGPRMVRPENLAELALPITAEYETFRDPLGAWLQANARHLGVALSRLSLWCDLGQHTLPGLVEHPEWAMTGKTERALCTFLGATIEKLNRLRPSDELRRASHAGAVATRRERYGDAAISRWSRTRMKAYFRRHPEALRAFREAGANGRAAYLDRARNQKRPETVKRKISATKLAQAMPRLRRLEKEHGAWIVEQRRRGFSFEIIAAELKGRLDELAWERLELPLDGSPESLVRWVHRVLVRAGIEAPWSGEVTPQDLRQAQRIAHPTWGRTREAAGPRVLEGEAEQRIHRARLDFVERNGQEPSVDELAHEAHATPRTVLKYRRNHGISVRRGRPKKTIN